MSPEYARLLHSRNETESLAVELASRFEPGMIVGLSGELGTGKSVFVRAAAAALGVTETMPSPTYTIVEEYTGGSIPILHIDLYRLTNPEEFYMLGLDDILERSVSFVEWIDRVPELAAEADISIEFTMGGSHFDQRNITITIPPGKKLKSLGDHHA